MAAKDVEKAEEQGLAEFFKLTSKINTSNMNCFDFDGKIRKYNSPGDHRRVLSQAVGILPETQGKHFLILFYVAMFKLTNASLPGLPCDRAAITVREIVEPGAFREDDREQGVSSLQPQKGGHRRRIAAEEVPTVPQGGKGESHRRNRGRRRRCQR